MSETVTNSDFKGTAGGPTLALPSCVIVARGQTVTADLRIQLKNQLSTTGTSLLDTLEGLIIDSVLEKMCSTKQTETYWTEKNQSQRLGFTNPSVVEHA